MIRAIITWVRLNITRRPIKIGERNGTPLIRAWCPTHGYFETIPSGWDRYVSCPECFNEQFRGEKTT